MEFITDTPLTVRIMYGCLAITIEETNITKQKQLLKEIQQTEQRISEAAKELYNHG